MTRFNVTRRSPSIPARLARERKWHLIPLYHLLRLSDTVREAMESSGSFRFADRIYVGKASGRAGIGTLIDCIVLSLPSSRSFRRRFEHVQHELASRIEAAPGAFRALSVPAGVPRDLALVAKRIDRPDVALFCLDIDREPLEIGRALTKGDPRFTMIAADAFDASAYPKALDAISSTGLAEFLDDEALVRFYSTCREALRPGGVLITSATRRHPLSAFLLDEIAEVTAHYRERALVEATLARAGFARWTIRNDDIGYQLLVVAEKG